MIRILHVIGAMDRGGAETMIMNFYRNMDLSNYYFDFLVHESKECDYDSEIKQLGGKIYSVPRFNITNYNEYKKSIHDFFSKHHDYDVVHGHICSSINIYFSEAKKYNIRTIAHSHSSNFGFSLETLFTNLISLRTRHIADYFIGCSIQAGLDRYGQKIVNSDRFIVLNNGIDVSKYEFNKDIRDTIRTQLGLNNKFVCGHVGRFTDAKNHEFLIKLFANIHKRDPHSVLLLFGRGELEDNIRKQVSSLKLNESVIFMGVVSNIADYLNALDIFLFPSKFEGLGIAVIEAEAAGLPCFINSDLPAELDVTNNVYRISLNEQISTWVNKIFSIKNKNIDTSRFLYNKIVHNSSFEINKEVKKLENLYLKLSK